MRGIFVSVKTAMSGLCSLIRATVWKLAERYDCVFQLRILVGSVLLRVGGCCSWSMVVFRVSFVSIGMCFVFCCSRI